MIHLRRLWTISLLLLFACSPDNTAREESPRAEIEQPQATDGPASTSLPQLAAGSLIPGHNAYSFLTGTGEEVRYLLFVPDEYEAGGQWPLILFLHGDPDSGHNIDRLIDDTLPEFLQSKQGFPFLVVSPQLPSGVWDKYIEPMEELLTHLSEILPVEPGRLYLTGLSAGSYGVWQYALRHPERFAAAAPIAGGATLGASNPVPGNICTLKDLPIWVFHGADDRMIPASLNIAVTDALKACGSDVKLTLYPGAGHADAWLNAYNDPAFYDWLLQHRNE